MIIDVTGTVLIPGNRGNDCPGSWDYAQLDFCCDECDYMMCCLETHDHNECLVCTNKDCPRSPNCVD